MTGGVAQLLAAELIVAALIALMVAAMLVRASSREMYVARALRDEARALLAGRDES
jgi:hypothetical protein